MVSERIVEEIKQRLDLVQYIGRTVDLKPAGRTHKAVCPFHVEKTPSFFVFPDTNSWHCFGACSEGGDIFSFVQKREGLSFRDALHALAEECGLRLEEESEQQEQKRLVQDRLLSCCEAAASVFQKWLLQRDDAENCRHYVKSRAFSAETIHRFGLGYAPNSWDNLLLVMSERGYDPEDLLLVGLVKRTERGRYYDALRNRLVFPIRNMRGRIVGFGGRIIEDDEHNPKYINSPQSIIFDKSSTLYGLDLAKDTIRKAETAVIVEGYIDVITAHQAGFNNVVASLGTALTEKQLRLVARYSSNVTLALDADNAGEKAAKRGLYRILTLQQQARKAKIEGPEAGLPNHNQLEGDIRVLMLPEGYDPDQLIREEPERWQKLITNAEPVIDYLIMQRINQVDLSDAIQKARVAADLLPLIRQLESNVVRHHYLQRLARLLQVDERHLEKEMAKYGGNRARKQSHNFQREAPAPPPPESSAPIDERQTAPEAKHEYSNASPDNPSQINNQSSSLPKATHQDNEPRDLEAYLLYLMLQSPLLVQEAQEVGLQPYMWQKTEHREIWQALLDNPPASVAHLEEFIQDFERPIAQQVRHIDSFYALFPPLEGQKWKNEAFNKLDQFFNLYEQRQQHQIKYLIDDLQSIVGDHKSPAEMQELLRRQTMIGQNSLKRQKQLHRRMQKHKS